MQPSSARNTAVLLSLGAGAALCVLIATSSQAASTRGGRPAPRSGATSSGNGPAVRPTPAPRPTPVPGARDVQLLQSALQRDLTAAEKTAITTAATTRDTSVKAAITAFETGVADLFGLSSSALQGKINRNCHGARMDLAAMLAKALGRDLTDSELVALGTLSETRDAAIELAVETFRQSAADAVGLTVAEVDAKIQAFLATQPRGGHDEPLPRPNSGTRA